MQKKPMKKNFTYYYFATKNFSQLVDLEKNSFQEIKDYSEMLKILKKAKFKAPKKIVDKLIEYAKYS